MHFFQWHYSLLFFVCHVVAEIRYGNGGEITSLNDRDVEQIVSNQQWSTPTCIVFAKEDPRKGTTQQYLKALNEWALQHYENKWQVLYCNTMASKKYQEYPLSRVQNSTKPSVICYIGDTSSYQFVGRSSKLIKWLQYIDHQYLGRPKIMMGNNVEQWTKTSGGKRILLFAIPGKLHFIQIGELLKKVPEAAEKILVLPDSEAERALYEKYGFFNFPTVLIFHQDRPGRTHRLFTKLEGATKLKLERVLLSILILKTRIPILNEKNFQREVVNHKRGYKPFLVMYFTPLDSSAYEKLHAFERAFHSFWMANRKDLRFALCDISDIKLAQVASPHMPTTGLHEFPIIALYRSLTDEGDQAHSKVTSGVLQVSMPTPWLLQKALESVGVLKATTEKATCNFRSHYLYCSANGSLTCSPGDVQLPLFGPYWDNSYKVPVPVQGRQKRPMKTIWSIPALDSYYWKVLFERSGTDDEGVKSFTGEFIRKESKGVKSKVVIHIMADCHYCTSLKGTFQELRRIATKKYSSSVFILNCTSEPELCAKNSINSFPTVLLYRGFTSREISSCFTEATGIPNLRFDYFGDFELKNLLQWIRSSSNPSVVSALAGGGKMPKTERTVQLLATVMSPAVARRYLPRSLAGKHFPFMCFKVLCERLHSIADCLVTESDLNNEGSKIFARKDLIVSEVFFRRQDGAESYLFKVMKPMEKTLNDGGKTEMHKFHQHHRYGLPGGFFCENDHRLCTETMYQYILDHHRLPVTDITHESFHVRHRNEGKDAFFSGKFPVLIAMMSHKRDAESEFFEHFYNAAQILYLHVVSVTLNIDEYPNWASRFVPRNYHDDHKGLYNETLPALFHYPRLCIVNWNDHGKAAFYPKLEEMESTEQLQRRLDNITSQEILNFTLGYLADPKSFVIDTEIY